MPETTPADELRAAAAKLRDMPGTVRAVITTEGEYADEHVVVLCEHDHQPPAIIDRHGCCQDCEYIRSDNPEHAHAVAALLAVAAPLTLLLGHIADNMDRYSAVEGSASQAVHPSCALGLAAPRADWTAALTATRAINTAAERNEQ